VIYTSDTRAQYESLKDELLRVTQEVMEKSHFILGENVEAFEQEFAAYCGTKYATGVGNGTDAISLSLRALGIGPGDEVITSPLTATFTALGISMSGAVPRFADVEPDTGNIDPAKIEAVITKRTKALVPVHLYGQMADLEPILNISSKHGIHVIEDAAQAHGATYEGKQAGSLGLMGCFSFYPTKNLGAYGDGGAVTTDDPDLHRALQELRNGGQETRYNHTRLGVCSRLDEIQAAILRVKLRHLDEWNRARRENARRYSRMIAERDLPVRPLALRDTSETAMHLYVVRVAPKDRDPLIKHLESCGVAAAIHYPTPVHLQKAYTSLRLGPGSFPEAEAMCRQIVTLPMYAELTEEQARTVVDGLESYYGGAC
jgi:dTDP-4-amino-4,6-dideoxygalactose transaminase